MSNEIIERVANAMEKAGNDYSVETGTDWRDIPLEILARAAIEAIRAMVKDEIEKSNGLG